jgi:hypothetical protein
VSTPRIENNSLYQKRKSCVWYARPASPEGRIAVVTDVEAGCDGREGAQGAHSAPDEGIIADGEIVRSRFPDAGIKLSRDVREGDGGQKARRTEEITYKP